MNLDIRAFLKHTHSYIWRLKWLKNVVYIHIHSIGAVIVPDIQSLDVPEVQSHCSGDRLCLTQAITGFSLVNNLSSGLWLAFVIIVLVWYKQHKLNVLDIQETETTTKVWGEQQHLKYLVRFSSLLI